MTLWLPQWNLLASDTILEIEMKYNSLLWVIRIKPHQIKWFLLSFMTIWNAKEFDKVMILDFWRSIFISTWTRLKIRDCNVYGIRKLFTNWQCLNRLKMQLLMHCSHKNNVQKLRFMSLFYTDFIVFRILNDIFITSFIPINNGTQIIAINIWNIAMNCKWINYACTCRRTMLN